MSLFGAGRAFLGYLIGVVGVAASRRPGGKTVREYTKEHCDYHNDEDLFPTRDLYTPQHKKNVKDRSQPSRSETAYE